MYHRLYMFYFRGTILDGLWVLLNESVEKIPVVVVNITYYTAIIDYIMVSYESFVKVVGNLQGDEAQQDVLGNIVGKKLEKSCKAIKDSMINRSHWNTYDVGDVTTELQVRRNL